MKERQVLDKGYIRLVEPVFGGDIRVLEAARVSSGASSKGEELDKKLIRYLLSNKHGTPFEHAVFQFHVKLPIFAARQWIRHRTSSYNEMSFRYREACDDFYIPTTWRLQDTKNKQGSVTGEVDHVALSNHLSSFCQEAMREYKFMLDCGIAREMARMVLPPNIYTEWYWTVNARALMNFIELRSEQHAQWEIRQYSNVLWQFFAEEMPWTAEAFLENLNLPKFQALDGVAGPNLNHIREAVSSK